MRLIDADRALEIARDQGIAHPNAYHLTKYATLILQEAPTIEVEPVQHGYWMCGDYYDVGDVCSECDWDSGMVNPTLRYCPNCGAKMDGESDE